jgi:glycosyltransferase involved in cell wall biosynthesis
VLRTPQNSGHGAAVRLGLEQAQGAWVFQTDSDRQHVPGDFWLLWARRDEADFVFGVRARRADGAVRMLISRVLRTVNLVLWGRDIADANCPFKLMRRDALRAVLAEVPRGTFIPMVMLAVLARVRGWRVAEVPVQHFPRSGGSASLSGLARWLSVGTRCAGELLALRLTLARGRTSTAAPGGAAGDVG